MRDIIKCECEKKEHINSVDLNDFTESGKYYCDSDRIAKFIINAPVRTAFYLQVEKLRETNESIQLLMEGRSGDIYYRVVSTEVTAWKKVVTENVLDEIIAEIRTILGEKADKTELIELENRLNELLNNKADISFVEDIERKLYEALSEKASNEALTALEEKILALLQLKADQDEVKNLEALVQAGLDSKTDQVDFDTFKTAVQTGLDSKADKDELASLENMLRSVISESLATLETNITDNINSKYNEQNIRFKNIEDELKTTFSLGGGIAIPKDADLNNYIEVGNYYCSYSGNALTVTNAPAELSAAFMLKTVYGNGTSYPSQILIELFKGNIYYRTFDSYYSSWGNWYKVSV